VSVHDEQRRADARSKRVENAQSLRRDGLHPPQHGSQQKFLEIFSSANPVPPGPPNRRASLGTTLTIQPVFPSRVTSADVLRDSDVERILAEPERE